MESVMQWTEEESREEVLFLKQLCHRMSLGPGKQVIESPGLHVSRDTRFRGEATPRHRWQALSPWAEWAGVQTTSCRPR